MADKSVDSLTRATQVNDDDLLVLEQGGEAKSLPGSLLKKYADAPTMQATSIPGGTRITITDKNGSIYFDVMNGEKGADGTVAFEDLT